MGMLDMINAMSMDASRSFLLLLIDLILISNLIIRLGRCAIMEN